MLVEVANTGTLVGRPVIGMFKDVDNGNAVVDAGMDGTSGASVGSSCSWG